MRLKLFLIFLFANFSFVFSQQQAAIWYFGKNAGLDFRSGYPVALTDGKLDTYEGCSTISDEDGNLLFYSDGRTILNRNHKTMVNGEGLLGHLSSTQSAIIIHNPYSPNIYYIFTVSGSDGFHYSEINMDLENGLGAVTNNKNVLLANPTTEKVTAVQHSNGKDIWVITHEAENDAFLAYLVNSEGVNMIPIKSNVGLNLRNRNGNNNIGYLKASPNGTKLGIAHWKAGVEVLDFDNTTGRISNPVTLVESMELHYGIEFSPNSKVLYSTTERGKILQYDLEAGNIPASAFLVHNSAPFTAALQIAIDGKIYIANKEKNLDAIGNPNILGAGCNFKLNAVDLKGRSSVWGLPPFMQSFFQFGDITVKSSCTNANTAFSITGGQLLQKILWEFGDGSTSTEMDPIHTYNSPGAYTVKVFMTIGGETVTETKEITIYEFPEARDLEDIIISSHEPSYSFDFSKLEDEVLGNPNKNDFQITFHPSFNDAENNINPLPFSFSSSNSEETIFVRIQNIKSPECLAITNFRILFNKMPIPGEVADTTVCGGENGSTTINLSEKTAELLNGQDPEEFAVSWFQSLDDVEKNLNPLPSLYTNSSPVQELFFRMFNISNPESYQSGSFLLKVISGVTAYTPADYGICEDNPDGFYEFDLATKNQEILGGQNDQGIKITYHKSAADAGEGKNPLPFIYTNTTAFLEPIFARVENKENPQCYDISSFNLIVTGTPQKNSVSNLKICDNDNDGIHNFIFSEKIPEILGNQNAEEFNVIHYSNAEDAETGTSPLASPWQNSASTQQLFYRVENRRNPGCYITGSYWIEVNISPEAHQASDIVVCDLEEGNPETFDLSTKDPEILGQQDPEIYTVTYYSTKNNALISRNPLTKKSYTNSSPEETIFARVDSKLAESCYSISSFSIIINKAPQPELHPQYVICPDAKALQLDGGNYDSWQWLDQEGTVVSTNRYFEISQAGSFTLKVSEVKNTVTCQNLVSFEVQTSLAATDFTFTAEHFSRKNQIVVTVNDPGEFEYSLDGRDFGKDNIFNVSPGKYTIYVRDVLGCRTLEKQVEVMGKMEYFTPNGDGFNDYWKLTGVGENKNYSVFIFDRYGKLLKQLLPGSPGWDGNFNGRSMPTEDYWFTAEMSDGRVYKGHFTLKR